MGTITEENSGKEPLIQSQPFIDLVDIPCLVSQLQMLKGRTKDALVAGDTETFAMKRPKLGDDFFGIPATEFRGHPFVSLTVFRLQKSIVSLYEKVVLMKLELNVADRETVERATDEITSLLALTRDKFNVGHWRDVKSLWRKLYTCLIVFKITFLTLQRCSSLRIIKECDMGLIMGQPILNNILGKIACEISDKIIQDQERLKPQPTKIPDVSSSNFSSSIASCDEFPIKNKSCNELPIKIAHAPSLTHFLKKYLIPNIPCVLVNTFNSWPAVEKWNVEYISKVAGFRTVPVEIGDKYTSENWTQKLMTISEFIATYMGNTPEKSRGYIAQYTLFEQISQLKDDIRIPEYCGLSEDSVLDGDYDNIKLKPLDNVEINSWFGPANTISPCHYDPKHNILVQIFGKKCIRLYPPGQDDYLRPHPESSMFFNTSQLDVEQENLFQDYPNMEKVVHYDFIIGPGDALYIPPKWWHYVKSLSPSFSISFWFDHS